MGFGARYDEVAYLGLDTAERCLRSMDWAVGLLHERQTYDVMLMGFSSRVYIPPSSISRKSKICSAKEVRG